MKVLCPKCSQPLALDYLETKGDQMGYCPKCTIHVSGNYKKDIHREYWELYFEKPEAKPKPPARDSSDGAVIMSILGFVFIVVLVFVILGWSLNN